jgi:co-chaperonin GroES (HSP10)
VIQPTQDRVLVEIILPKLRKGSIILAPEGDATCADAKGGDYRRNSVKAKILAVGPGKWKEKPNGERYFQRTIVRVGQIVMCTEWNDLADYLPKGQALIMEGDIIGVLKN